VACGVPPKQRASRLEESLEIIRGLARGEPYEYQGKYFQFEKVKMFSPPALPQILVATGNGRFVPRQHYRVARWGDGAIMNLDTPEEVRRLREAIFVEAEKLGRESSGLHFCMYVTVHVGPEREKAAQEAEEWLTKYYLRSWGHGRCGPFGPAELIVERMQEYAAAGIDSFCVRFAAYDQRTQLERFTEGVLPHVRQAAAVR
jgi:alkanesulfonate monooxygenase SsuD/methylene tetrahydromethanopterin reductase-like flavin-dependent oxidoreductase (luciferase family)